MNLPQDLDNKDSLKEPAHELSGASALARAFAQFLRGQIWILLTLLMGVIALEFGLRALRPDLAGLVYGPLHTGGHPIAFSEKSFRIPEGQSSVVPPTILALGDSTTFGTGVAAEDTWPLRLGSTLPGDFATANAGFPGGELRLFSQSLETLWTEPTSPDVVLLLVTGNMVSFTEFRSADPVLDPLLRVRAAEHHAAATPGLSDIAVSTVQSSAIWKFVSSNVETFKYGLGLLTHHTDAAAPLCPLLAYGWQQSDFPEGYHAKMWGTFQRELEDLAQVTRAQQACLIIGFLPPRFMISDRRADNLKFVPKSRLNTDAPTRVRQLAEELGVQFVDMTASLKQARERTPYSAEPFYISNDYTHLNAAGHEVVAQTFRTLLESDPGCRLHK